MLRETPNSFSPNQYFNQNNPGAHYENTEPEVWNDTEGEITHFVAGIGTGGTISGTGKLLKENNPNIKIIGADPNGSFYHHKLNNEEVEIQPYKTERIEEDFMPETVHLDVLYKIIVVGDKQAHATTRDLEKEKLLIGSSSGAAFYAALEKSKKLNENDVVAVLLPDKGRNYLSTLFNDEWMKNNDLV